MRAIASPLSVSEDNGCGARCNCEMCGLGSRLWPLPWDAQHRVVIIVIIAGASIRLSTHLSTPWCRHGYAPMHLGWRLEKKIEGERERERRAVPLPPKANDGGGGEKTRSVLMMTGLCCCRSSSSSSNSSRIIITIIDISILSTNKAETAKRACTTTATATATAALMTLPHPSSSSSSPPPFRFYPPIL